MSVIDKLSSSLGQRDEKPNQALARKIVSESDAKAVQELVENLQNSNARIQSDCIKVLYEIGEQEPKLIAKHVKDFVRLLESNNNRLQWGAMTALDAIAHLEPKPVFVALKKILAIADSGSVITRDHAVGILIKLAARKEYVEKVFPSLLAQLKSAPTNQLPMYAENALPVINEKYKSEFVKTLAGRLKDVEKETKRKRVEKVIRKLEKS